MPAKTPRITAEDFLARAREMGLDPKPSGDGYACRCPAHDDRHPSLTFAAGEKTELVVKCHRGENPCSFKDIMAAMGFDPAGVARTAGTPVPRAAPPKEKKPPRVYPSPEVAITAQQRYRHDRVFVKSWSYHDADGLEVMRVARWNLKPTAKEPDGGKRYSQLSRRENGWVWKKMNGIRPLYGLPALKDAVQVLVVEGEKCADCLRGLGLVATTSSQGAGSAHLSDWSPLAGTAVVGFPDNDKAGESYMSEVAAQLRALSPSTPLRLARLPGLPDAGDVVDFVEAKRAQGRSDQEIRGEIEGVIAAASAVDHSIRALREYVPARKEWMPVPVTEIVASPDPEWIWPGYLARGHVTILTGLWKSGKSTLISHLIRDLGRGGPLAPVPLGESILVVSEESDRHWARRARDLEMTNKVHVLAQPFARRPSREDWEAFIEVVANLTARVGYALVVFDTISSSWCVDDENDASKVQDALLPTRAVTGAGASLLFVHHPKKGEAAHGSMARGSGSLLGWVDIILEFDRLPGAPDVDTRRLIRGFSRLEDTPREMVFDRSERGYVRIGERASADQGDRLGVIGSILARAAKPMTPLEVRTAWPEGTPPGVRLIESDLAEGVRVKGWVRTGKGVKNDPYRFHDASTFDSRSPTLLSARTESNTAPGGEVAS